MEKSQKRSLREEFYQDVEQTEKEIAKKPELEQIRVTKEMDEALFAKIREYEKTKETEMHIPSEQVLEKSISEEMIPEEMISEELVSEELTSEESVSEEMISEGPVSETLLLEDVVPDMAAVSKGTGDFGSRDYVKVKRKKKKIRWIAALAAVLVLILGVGMTSVGSKSYWKELLDILIGEGSARVINVEDMETQKTEDLDELAVYQEVGEKLGQRPVWMRYKPEFMRLTEYEIDENLRVARMVYDYQGNFIRYTMYASLEDSSWTTTEDDKIEDEYVIEINGTEIIVEEISKSNREEKTRVAKFEYAGIYYELKGVIEKEELEKILENLYFL